MEGIRFVMHVNQQMTVGAACGRCRLLANANAQSGARLRGTGIQVALITAMKSILAQSLRRQRRKRTIGRRGQLSRRVVAKSSAG